MTSWPHTSGASLSKEAWVAEALSSGECGAHEINALSIAAAVTGILTLIWRERGRGREGEGEEEGERERERERHEHSLRKGGSVRCLLHQYHVSIIEQYVHILYTHLCTGRILQSRFCCRSTGSCCRFPGQSSRTRHTAHLQRDKQSIIHTHSLTVDMQLYSHMMCIICSQKHLKGISFDSRPSTNNTVCLFSNSKVWYTIKKRIQTVPHHQPRTTSKVSLYIIPPLFWMEMSEQDQNR